MSDAPRDRHALENRWRENVCAARQRLDSAHALVEERRQDVRSAAVPSPDGQYGYRLALQAESAALEEYGRVLQIFIDLVYRNKIPPDRG